MRKVKITGQIVSTNGVTLFFDNGKSEVLSQESWRTKNIMEAIMPAMIQNGFAEIDLDAFAVPKALEHAVEPLAKEGIELIEDDLGKVSLKTATVTIPDAAPLVKHINRAAFDGAKGLKAFLDDFAKVATKRRHSADDLLKFMEKADLPIADDGSIVVYKILRGSSEGRFVDCHTGKVPQRLGSVVTVPEDMVDPNRSKDCSRGLHVCSVNYVGSFSGSGIFLAKVRASDTIAVPEYEGTKMRVCRYHLVAQLSDAAYAELREGKSAIHAEDAKSVLGAVVAGNHIREIETVHIAGENGTNVTVTAIEKDKAAPKRVRAAKPKHLEKTVAPEKAAPPPKLSIKEIKEKAAAFKRPGQSMEKAVDYIKKLVQAKALQAKGMSLRQIAEKLGMDRNSLAKNLAEI